MLKILFFLPPFVLKKKSRSEDTSEGENASRAKGFLAEMKKSLSQVTFAQIMKAMQSYKESDNLDILLTETGVLSQDANTHSLFRGKLSALQFIISNMHIYTVVWSFCSSMSSNLY